MSLVNTQHVVGSLSPDSGKSPLPNDLPVSVFCIAAACVSGPLAKILSVAPLLYKVGVTVLYSS